MLTEYLSEGLLEMMLKTLAGLCGLMLATTSYAALAAPPAKIGTCSASVIIRIGTRFSDKLVQPKGDGIDEGTSVEMKNGVYGISYSFVPAVAASRVGDKVLTCLVSVPQGCPKGDDRGRVYTTTNLRTQGSFTLTDSQHMCGGA